MATTTLPTIDPHHLEHVTGGGFDIGSLLSMGQQIAGSVGGPDGQKAADVMGKVAPMIQKLAGSFGGGGSGGGGGTGT